MRGTKILRVLGLAACAASSVEAFELDKSVMSDKYWQIWNPAEQARIDADIERFRKADMEVEGLPAGVEVKVDQLTHAFVFGAHLFNFNQLGSDERNARHQAMFGHDSLFNSATISFYWRPFEPEEGKPRFAAAYEDTAEYWNKLENPWADWRWRRPASDPCVEFCEKKGIRSHGHTIAWGSDFWQTPSWYYDKGVAELPFMKNFLRTVSLSAVDKSQESRGKKGTTGDVFMPYKGSTYGVRYQSDPAKLKEFLSMSVEELEAKAPKFVKALNDIWERRTVELARHYGKRVQSWDVVNESSVDYGLGVILPGDKICRSHYGPLPGDYPYVTLKCAEKAFPPEVKLNINDYQFGYNNAYGRQVTELLRRGAKVDIVGAQMHLFDYKKTLGIAAGEEIQTPKQVRAIMDRLAAPGRPIHLSEITVTSPGDDEKGRMIQAVALYNLYRLWFSIQPMMGITYWNTVDDCGAPGEPKWSGIMTRDVQPKPAYYALDRLVNKEWKTHLAVKTDADGKLAFRGFRGLYRLTWKDADGTTRTREVRVD